MRRLRTAYTGNLLRLRRSSDNAESDFGYLANGDLDAAAIAAFVGGGSVFVATWYDQSGNGNNATQTTAANQPLYVSQAAGMTFDGTNDHLVTGVLPASGWSMLVRLSNFTRVSGCAVGAANVTNFFVVRSSDASLVGLYNGTDVSLTANSNTAGVWGVTPTDRYVDGVDVGDVGTWSGGALAVGVRIGARGFAGSADQFAAVSIRELAIANAAWTAPHVTSITAIMG